MAKTQDISVLPKMLADGTLHIEVTTDQYKTQMHFVRDGGAAVANACVREGIKRGLVKDIRIVEFFRREDETLDISYVVKRRDGTLLDEGGVFDLKLEGVDITPAGIRH